MLQLTRKWCICRFYKLVP